MVDEAALAGHVRRQIAFDEAVGVDVCRRLLEDGNLRLTMAEAAREMAVARADWRQMIVALEEMWREQAAEREAAARDRRRFKNSDAIALFHEVIGGAQTGRA